MHPTKTLFAALLAAPLLLAAQAAHAKDLCVYRDDGSFFAQLRGFQVPQKGKCKPVAGTHANGTLHGSACRTSDGATLRFGTTTNIGAGIFSSPKVRQHNFTLAYPALDSGGGSEFTAEGGVGVSHGTASLPPLNAAFCKAGAIQ